MTASLGVLGQADVDVEEADLRVLEENISTMKKLTQGINDSLLKFSDTANRAENSIRPVIEKTEKLQIYSSSMFLPLTFHLHHSIEAIIYV